MIQVFVLPLTFSGSQNSVTLPLGVPSIFLPYPISGSLRFTVVLLVKMKKEEAGDVGELVVNCLPTMASLTLNTQ